MAYSFTDRAFAICTSGYESLSPEMFFQGKSLSGFSLWFFWVLGAPQALLRVLEGDTGIKGQEKQPGTCSSLGILPCGLPVCPHLSPNLLRGHRSLLQGLLQSFPFPQLNSFHQGVSFAQVSLMPSLCRRECYDFSQNQ